MDPQEKDLFSPEADNSNPGHQVPPSESVFVDMGVEDLFYIGEVQLPRPLPVEIIIEVDGWDYTYTLSARAKS